MATIIDCGGKTEERKDERKFWDFNGHIGRWPINFPHLHWKSETNIAIIKMLMGRRNQINP